LMAHAFLMVSARRCTAMEESETSRDA